MTGIKGRTSWTFAPLCIMSRSYPSGLSAIIRKGRDPEDYIVFAFNFTPVPRIDYRIGLPKAGVYREVMNSDSSSYWGSNVGNAGEVQAEETPFNQWP